MQPVRGQAHQHVTSFNFIAGDDLLFFHNANNESGKIVFAFGIEAGHLRGFTANQRATVMAAGLGNSLNNFFRNVRLQVAGGQVIHEEERSSALHCNVIHAMIDQITTYGMVQLHHERHFQLGAYTVNAGNQNRLAEFLFINGKKTAKAANLPYDAAGESAVGQVFNALFGAVCAVNIHAAIGVSDGSSLQDLRSIFCGVGHEILAEGTAILSVILPGVETLIQRNQRQKKFHLPWGLLPASSNSLPTESSTPLINCTDSGEENLRA